MTEEKITEKAFVLGTVSPETSVELLQQNLENIKKYAEVKQASYIYGNYDIILKIEARDRASITATTQAIWKHGVTDTETMTTDKTYGLSFEREGCDDLEKCAYVFLKVAGADLTSLSDPLHENQCVLEAHALYGRFDVVVSVKEDARSDLFRKVIKQVRLLYGKGVFSTLTYFTIRL